MGSARRSTFGVAGPPGHAEDARRIRPTGECVELIMDRALAIAVFILNTVPLEMQRRILNAAVLDRNV